MNTTLSQHSQEYRAHTPEQKKEIIDRLYHIWLERPELRLGQLVTRFGRGLYNTEDYDLIVILEGVYLPKHKERTPSGTP